MINVALWRAEYFTFIYVTLKSIDMFALFHIIKFSTVLSYNSYMLTTTIYSYVI